MFKSKSKTKSEELFEQYCSHKSINCKKIPKGNIPKADYLIWNKDYKIIVEVTQLELNNNEKEIIKKMETENPVTNWPKTENRIRQKIIDKKNQIENSVKEYENPSLLLIFDNRGTLFGINSDNIKYAMYGKDSHVIYYNGNLEKSWYGYDKFGGSRSLRKNKKTYISALGLLYYSQSELKMAIYHNYYAINPIDPKKFKVFTDLQFTIDEPHVNYQKDWYPIKKEL